MKKMSVFQITLLAVFGAIAVAAVLIFALAVGGGASNTTGPVTIWGTLDQNAFTTVIRAAAENQSALSQVKYVQHDAATYDADLINALASGQGPDLFLMTQDSAAVNFSRIVSIPYSSLSQSQFEASFIDAANPFLSESGVVAIPLSADPLVLYWNKDMMNSAGYAKQPAYWDELYDMAQKITTKNDTGSIEKSALSFGEYANVNAAKDILSMLILQAGGSITTRDSSGKLIPALTPRVGETTQATASALRFYTEFADPSKADYTWSRALPESRQAFASGDLALYIGYASEEPLIRRMNPNLNFGVAPVPQIRGAARAIDVGKVYGFAIPRTAKNPSGAITVAYLLSATEISKSLSVALGIPSARRDVLSQKVVGESDVFNKQAIIMRSWIDPDPAKTEGIFRDMIENTTSGALLVNEAVQRADQALGHVLGL